MEVAPSAYLNLTRSHAAPAHGRFNNNNYQQHQQHQQQQQQQRHHQQMPPPGHQSQSSSSQYSAFSQYTPRSSASTNATSLSGSTLVANPPALPTPPLSGLGGLPTPTGPPANGGPIVATNNVLNTRAGEESSLFQICLNLRQRLLTVPDFAEILREEEEDADEDTDPVTLLWRTFRRGNPLMTIYNALNPRVRLEIDETKVKDIKRPQAATMKFL
ncbi:MAG: hypothetical protein INR71_01210, partial [Terriglobus roseus]|nr:hypothetical protein [Terriglobus roseus]